jgi:hypothetical protein
VGLVRYCRQPSGGLDNVDTILIPMKEDFRCSLHNVTAVDAVDLSHLDVPNSRIRRHISNVEGQRGRLVAVFGHVDINCERLLILKS